MKTTIQSLGIDRMPLEDRLRLLEELSANVAHEMEQGQLPEARQKEIDRRLEAHAANPAAATAWEQAHAEARARTA